MVDKTFPTDFTDATDILEAMKLLGDDGAENVNVPVGLLRSYLLSGTDGVPMKAACARKTTDQPGLAGTDIPITFDDSFFDDPGFLDLANNRFDILEDGLYLFGAHAQLLSQDPTQDAYLAPEITSSLTQPDLIRWSRDNHDLSSPGLQGVVPLRLQAGDNIELHIFGDDTDYDVRADGCYMFLIQLTQSGTKSGGWAKSGLLSLSADQTTGLTASDPVQFDTAEGDLAVSNNQITIPANSTALLEAALYFNFSAAAAFCTYEWYDVTNGAAVGLLGISQSITRSSNDSGDISAVARVSPSVDTVYEVRINTPQNVTHIESDASHAKISSTDPNQAVIVHTITSGEATAGAVDLAIPNWRNISVQIAGSSSQASASAISQSINGDTTATNYHHSGFTVSNGGSPTGFEAATPPRVGGIDNGEDYCLNSVWQVGPDRVVFQSQRNTYVGSNNVSYSEIGGFYEGTHPAAITEVNIRADNADALKTGSVIVVQNLEAVTGVIDRSGGDQSFIREVEVTVATDSVDVEVPGDWQAFDVVITLVNDDASPDTYSLYLNNDTTATNYHRQTLAISNGGAAGGGESSDAVIASLPTGRSAIIKAAFALHPDELVTLIETGESDGADNVRFANTALVYEGTNPTEFSAINLRSTNASGIGVGTKILLTRKDATANGSFVDSYSETETATNKRWIDGKIIYRKVVEWAATKPNISSETQAHGITGLERCIDLRLIYDNGSGVQLSIGSTNTVATTDDEFVTIDGTNVNWSSGANRTTATDVYAVIEYTKA